MSPLEVAVTMYHREHDRWSKWALFFFGSVASVFVLWGELRSIPLWVPALVATSLSLCWVMVALDIRASTCTWRAVALEIEASPDGSGRPFALYAEKARQFSRHRDLCETLFHWRTESFFSVTRILTILGVLSAILFLLLAILAASGIVNVPSQQVG